MSARIAFRHLTAVALGFVFGIGALLTAWINGVDVPLVSGRTTIDIVKLDRAGYSGQADGVVFIALVGSDYRPGLGGERGDGMHVVALNPALGEGTILNVPRDTCANVPGRGTSKINNAHSEGGPQLAGEVLAELTGAPIQYAVSVDFAGFIGIVDGVGGFEVDIPFEMSDRYSGAYFSPGPRQLNGGEALAFARNRHDFGPGDIQRTWNQGHLIIAGMQKLRTAYASPSQRFTVLSLLHRHAKIHGAGLRDLFQIAQAAYDVDPARIKGVAIPTSGGECLSVSSAADALFADFVDDGVLQSHAGGTPENPTGR